MNCWTIESSYIAKYSSRPINYPLKHVGVWNVSLLGVGLSIIHCITLVLTRVCSCFPQNCRICTDCGSRTPGSGPSSRWHLNYSVCDSCYQQRNKGLCCPLCGKAYRHFHNSKTMLPCNICKK